MPPVWMADRRGRPRPGSALERLMRATDAAFAENFRGVVSMSSPAARVAGKSMVRVAAADVAAALATTAEPMADRNAGIRSRLDDARDSGATSVYLALWTLRDLCVSAGGKFR